MTDEYETAYHGPYAHPVIATLAGCAVLVLAAILVPRMLPAQPQMTLIGAALAAAFVLWLIGLIVTTRLAGLGWIAGSLLILLGAGALTGYLTHRQYDAVGREDPSSFAQIEFGPQGNAILPKNASTRGPISKLFAASVAADTSERRDYDTALAKFGVGNLSSPYLLKQNPQTIAKCGDLAGMKTLAQSHVTKRAERAAEIGKAIDAAALDTGLKDAIRAIAAPAGEDPRLGIQTAFLDSTAELCALLAKRGWYDENGYFGFNSGGDAARYKALQAKRAEAAAASEKLDKDAVVRMKAEQEKVRAALS
ncbi:MAG: hypothetical protein EOP62_07580 [Sphingomonadales bacterium]|nr:MAG: hypothetical protein EOP62_07580 [Sphingomonadales bacterium]